MSRSDATVVLFYDHLTHSTPDEHVESITRYVGAVGGVFGVTVVVVGGVIVDVVGVVVVIFGVIVVVSGVVGGVIVDVFGVVTVVVDVVGVVGVVFAICVGTILAIFCFSLQFNLSFPFSSALNRVCD